MLYSLHMSILTDYLKKLTKAEVKFDATYNQLEQTKSQLITLSQDVSKLQHLDRVKKDIDRNLWPDKQ